MKELKFRNARPDEIELRVGATNDSGFSLLLYKTARVDANILDETVGAFNWQKRYYQVKQTMICEIGIYNEERNEWVWKGDAGDESNTEAIKGEASDSFKRAGFAWNICRSLYSSPFIWVKKDQDNDPKKSHYLVKTIDYTNNEISKLVIINEKTKQVVFSMDNNPKASQNAQNQGYNHSPKATPSNISKDYDNNMKKVRAFAESLPADKFTPFFNWLEKKYNTRIITQLTADQLIEVINLYKIKDIEE